MTRPVSAGVSLLLWAAAAGAADPPRIEQLSNPQSQSIGKKVCPGLPGVYVPMFDPCPGERAPAAGPGGGGSAAPTAVRPMPAPPPPRVPDPMNAQRDRQRAVELQKEAWNYSLGRGGVPHDPRRAYQLYISVCTLAPDLEGCGVAAGMLLDDPVAYRGEGSDRDPVLLERVILGLAEPGCRAGDLQACFALAYTQRRAGRQVTAPAFRGVEAEEYEAYAARRREYQREQAALRAQPAPARLPPAPPSGATLPAPVAALAPAAAPAAASPPRITSEGNGTAAYWIAEHKRLNYQGTEWMMKALLLEPDNAEAHHLLGEIYARKEWDLDRAVAEAQRATTLEPGNASYWRGLGVVLARAQRRPEALRALQKSKELEPADPKTQLELGRVLCAAGRRQEAISAFETALDRQPELPQALDDYNRCRSRLGLAALKSQPPRAAAARP